MAGRPRTMAKKVRRLLERHQQLTEELRNLGKHHMPAPGERWDFELPGGDVNPIPPLWRRAVSNADGVSDDIDTLLCFLELKAEKAELSAKVVEIDATDDLNDEHSAEREPEANNAPAYAQKASEPSARKVAPR